MSQEVMIAGALFSDVPSIRVPDSNGNFHPFTDVSDTTAAAADVATGKYFYAADGTRTAGTNSGGGGGASNFVTGTFTVADTTTAAADITIPYTGNGYPIAAIVVIEGGAYNPNNSWYNATYRYAVGQWTYTKSNMASTPTYETSGEQNQGVVTSIFKNSTSTATSYSRASGMSVNVLTSADAANGQLECICFKSATTMSYRPMRGTYGLRQNTTYRYFIVYSG